MEPLVGFLLGAAIIGICWLAFVLMALSGDASQPVAAAASCVYFTVTCVMLHGWAWNHMIPIFGIMLTFPWSIVSLKLSFTGNVYAFYISAALNSLIIYGLSARKVISKKEVN